MPYSVIAELRTLAASKTAREQKAIFNLCQRLEHFHSIGDEEKLGQCKAEADLWRA